MPKANSRAKGRQGEREFLNLIAPLLGMEEPLQRNLQAAYEKGGADCLEIPSISLEIKRAAKPSLNAWWKQAIAQAEEVGRIPVLAYRIDFQKWVVRVPLDMFLASPAGAEYWIEMTPETFAYQYAQSSGPT